MIKKDREQRGKKFIKKVEAKKSTIKKAKSKSPIKKTKKVSKK